MSDEDDRGQVDGENESPFSTSMRAAPWMRGAQSPWHLWGNTQTLVLPPNPFTIDDTFRIFVRQTLVRVAYARPETWHYMASVKAISGPSLAPTFQGNISLDFQVYSGIGRSVMQFSICEGMGFGWNFSNFPAGVTNWSNTSSSGYQQFDSTDPAQPFQTSRVIPTDQFIGQDITIVAVSHFVTDLPNAQPVTIEVSCQVAPKTHVRPDWFQIDATPSEQFSGEEIRGR